MQKKKNLKVITIHNNDGFVFMLKRYEKQSLWDTHSIHEQLSCNHSDSVSPGPFAWPEVCIELIFFLGMNLIVGFGFSTCQKFILAACSDQVWVAYLRTSCITRSHKLSIRRHRFVSQIWSIFQLEGSIVKLQEGIQTRKHSLVILRVTAARIRSQG